MYVYRVHITRSPHCLLSFLFIYSSCFLYINSSADNLRTDRQREKERVDDAHLRHISRQQRRTCSLMEVVQSTNATRIALALRSDMPPRLAGVDVVRDLNISLAIPVVPVRSGAGCHFEFLSLCCC